MNLAFAIIWAAEPSACAVATTRCNGAFTGLGDRPLLGMNVLGRLRWQQHDGVLRIEPGQRRE